jgi:hypothetical protein
MDFKLGNSNMEDIDFSRHVEQTYKYTFYVPNSCIKVYLYYVTTQHKKHQ